jgi:outer membrane protein assembly factor BamB
MGSSGKYLAFMLSLVIFASVSLQPITAIVISNSSTARQNWSMFGSDPSHDRVGTDNSTSNSVLNPEQLWQSNLKWEKTETEFQYRERSLTETVVVDGVVYIGASSSVTIDRYHRQEWIDVFALNATDGVTIWDYRDNSSYTITPPAVVNNVVYFATERYVCALRANDSYLLWNYSSGSFNSYPVVAQNMLFIGGGKESEGILQALNATNGYSIWNFTNDVNSRTFGTPAIANGLVYVGSFDEKIYGLNMSTGEKILSYQSGDFHPAPTVANGIVYGITSGANIYALDEKQGNRIWNYSIYDGWDTGQQPYFQYQTMSCTQRMD